MLAKLLELDQISDLQFVAHNNQSNFRKTLFGGQVLAQALKAAALTTDRTVHSMHAYFLRAGHTDKPVEYRVERIRDGRTVSTRRVEAFQGTELIYSMMSSFHNCESGYAHQTDAEISFNELKPHLENECKKTQDTLKKVGETLGMSPIEFIPGSMDFITNKSPRPPQAHCWLRCADALPSDPLTHACALAFASDIGLLATTLLPHDTTLFSGEIQAASMDHAIWFHRPVQFDQWVLYENQSPWSGCARALARGAFYDSEGRLIASTAQEGLIRPIAKS